MAAYRAFLVWTLRVMALLSLLVGASSAWGTISYGIAMREEASLTERAMHFVSVMLPFAGAALVLLALAETLALLSKRISDS